MKKVIKPQEKEEAVYFSDFTGKSFGQYGPPVNINIEFNYGSDRDGASLSLHLSDEDLKPIIEVIKQNLSLDVKQELTKKLKQQEQSFEDSMQFRDWHNCDLLSNSNWFLRDLLDIQEEEL